MSFAGGGGGLNEAAGDLLWLRLDTTNDPLTGVLRAVDGTGGSPTYSFANDTDTGIRRGTAPSLILQIGGSSKLILAAGLTTFSQVIQGASGTSSIPAYGFTVDPNTGMSRTAVDTLSLLTGGTEAVRIDSAQALHITTGGTLNIVSEGTVDSGGAGFRILRVPN